MKKKSDRLMNSQKVILADVLTRLDNKRLSFVRSRAQIKEKRSAPNALSSRR
jgi:hypothetical protein